MGASGIKVWRDPDYPDFEIHCIAKNTYSVMKQNGKDFEAIGDVWSTLDDAISSLEEEVIRHELSGRPARIHIRTTEAIKQELQKKADKFYDGNLSQLLVGSAIGKTKLMVKNIFRGDWADISAELDLTAKELSRENELLSISHNITGYVAGYRLTIIALVKDVG